MPAFWFHFNKPETAKRGPPVMTVHYRGQCLMVEGIDCAVPVKTRVRKQQPVMVMAGSGVVQVTGGVAVIRDTGSSCG
jgi:hypothetical protein